MNLLPPLQKLTFALAVARELHFTMAARRLNITQPYLSRAIREYESELRFMLFRRNRRLVELTKAGRVFLSRANKMLAELNTVYSRTVEEARIVSRQNSSSFVIGYSAFIPSRLRCQIRTIQRAQFPALHLELRAATPMEALESITNGVFHAGVMLAPLDRDDLAYIPLRTDRLYVVFPRVHPPNSLGEIVLADLKTQPLIVPCSEAAHPGLRRWLLEQCAIAEFTPNIVEEVLSADNVYDLVLDGVGIAILPGEACEGLPPDLQSSPLANLEPLELVLAYRRDAPGQVQTVVAEISNSLRHFEHRRKIFSHPYGPGRRHVVPIASRRPRTNNWKASKTA
jgi:DNA-binding transcriptional LysR family regulator